MVASGNASSQSDIEPHHWVPQLEFVEGAPFLTNCNESEVSHQSGRSDGSPISVPSGTPSPSKSTSSTMLGSVPPPSCGRCRASVGDVDGRATSDTGNRPVAYAAEPSSPSTTSVLTVMPLLLKTLCPS